MWQWILHVTGIDNPAGPFYAFWSGIGSDLGEATIILAALSFWWRHTCHVKGCWRVGRHPVDGTAYVVCKKHHPDGEPTAEHILRRHKRR